MSPYERNVTLVAMDKHGMLSDTIRHAFPDSDACRFALWFMIACIRGVSFGYPDIIIVPLNWMPRCFVSDDLSVENNRGSAAVCIAVSPINDAVIIQKTTGIDIPYLVVPHATFHQCLEYLCNRQPRSAEQDPVSLHETQLKKAIAERTQYIGVPVHLKGYQYICAAIYLLTTYTDMHPGVTKFVYPTVANLYKTTASCVERSIRHAIGIAWDRSPDSFKSIFGESVARYCPTNNELLSLMKEQLLREFPIQEDSLWQNLLA